MFTVPVLLMNIIEKQLCYNSSELSDEVTGGIT